MQPGLGDNEFNLVPIFNPIEFQFILLIIIKIKYMIMMKENTVIGIQPSKEKEKGNLAN